MPHLASHILGNISRRIERDWEIMLVAEYGEFFEKLLLLSAFPLASIFPEGPVTWQEATPLPLHVMVEVPPVVTRIGFALIVAFGARTVTEANAGAEVPPAPVQLI